MTEREDKADTPIDAATLAEMVWDVARPCLSEAEHVELCTMWHIGDVEEVMIRVVRRLGVFQQPVPSALYRQLTAYAGHADAAKRHGQALRSTPAQLAPLIARLYVCPDEAHPFLGGYGSATLTHFLLEELGCTDSDDAIQGEAVAGWLRQHRPSPALRIDLRVCGFGPVLDEWESR